MFARVPYLNLSGKHRPYLEVVFFNPNKATLSPKFFGLLDSGADCSVIPYSLGVLLQLDNPTEKEFSQASGVAGRLSYIERKCHIGIFNKPTNEVFTFNDEVYWAHPDMETQAKLKMLQEEYKGLEGLQGQVIVNTPLAMHFQNELLKKKGEIDTINNIFETDILLGRPFFENFDFIQFLHRDRSNEARCSFNYRVSEKKIIEKTSLTTTS